MLSRRRLVVTAGGTLVASHLPLRSQPAATTDRLQPRALHATPAGNIGDDALGYDGTVPGPVLRVRRGNEMHVRLVNGLTEPTTIHWHGLRLPNAMDGVPALTQPPVAPATSFDYRFRPPDAGTFWYRALDPLQVERGLFGALVVAESRTIDVDEDIVLVLGRRRLDGEILVNGALRPDIPVKSGSRLRLRLVNATSAHGLGLKLDAHALWVMAVDGQPAEPFVARDSRVGLGPGSRIDLFVDMAHQTGRTAPLLALPGGEQGILRFVYGAGGGNAKDRRHPDPLPPNPLPERIDLRSAHRVEWLLDTAPQALDPAASPMFSVRRGRSVALTIRNRGGPPRVVHVHGHHFRLLDRLDDGWKPYWLDTLVVGDQTERIAFVADNPGRWLIESRALERPESTASAWFGVS